MTPTQPTAVIILKGRILAVTQTLYKDSIAIHGISVLLHA